MYVDKGRGAANRALLVRLVKSWSKLVESRQSDPLDELRRLIDQIDVDLVELISRRGDVVRRIGELKAQRGTPVYSPDREKQVLDRIAALNKGPFSTATLQAIYRELMSGSFSLERPLRIAFLGPRGSFSHLAASTRFGASIDYEPVTSIAAALHAVEREHADFAVIPLENSRTGIIIETLDALLEAQVRLCAEHYQRIRHNLIARGPLTSVARVYSKPEVFDQCRNWLMETGFHDKTVSVGSTSKAVELAAAQDDAAAIGSSLAAEIYQVPVQVAGVEDDPDNSTRFVVAGRAMPRPTAMDRTSIVFTTSDRAGALADVLDEFRRAGVNLSLITSRPSRRASWEYAFYLEALGHVEADPMKRVLEAIRPHCLQLRVLGSYPRVAGAA